MSLINKIAMKNNFKQQEIDEKILSTIDLSATEVGATVREALEEARDVFKRLPARHAGMLFVDESGAVVTTIDKILDGADGIRAIEPRRGGNWPSSAGIDHALIERIIEAFGIDPSSKSHS